MTPLTPEKVAELRTLLEAATPGPWFRETEDIVPGGPYEDKWSEVSAPDGKVATVGYADSDWRQDSQNASLIAAAINALPDLLEAVQERDALREAIAKARKELGSTDDRFAKNANIILAAALSNEVTDAR